MVNWNSASNEAIDCWVGLVKLSRLYVLNCNRRQLEFSDGQQPPKAKVQWLESVAMFFEGERVHPQTDILASQQINQ